MLECFGDKRIISASRRTDIPAYYPDWFVNRLESGYCRVMNPYSRQVSRVSLSPSKVAGIVFWSKNYGPLIPRLDRIRKIIPNLFFHFTITGLGPGYEPATSAPDQCVAQAKKIAQLFGPKAVIWRFDPVLGRTREELWARAGAFEALAGKLSGHVRLCSLGFVDMYPKVAANLGKKGMAAYVPGGNEKYDLAMAMVEKGRKLGLEVAVCCEQGLADKGMNLTKCIDGPRLARLWQSPGLACVPRASTREGCHCTKSVDIGRYGTCPNMCLYCYANVNHSDAVRRWKTHDNRRDSM